ncbi:hypothetical protein pdam_00020421 [Pocillopora damicornis]|uniref:Uncharacterized protein n=1 Tax=Pocillopora damicornis TaxID=46731 RepID=A0A3M6TMK7_POCDA|nr:hypothetical protein pdam_00020421 [Pocillopora damicornis]
MEAQCPLLIGNWVVAFYRGRCNYYSITNNTKRGEKMKSSQKYVAYGLTLTILGKLLLTLRLRIVKNINQSVAR